MHDRDGKPLQVGDKVNVPCTIKEIQAGPDFCNTTLEADEKMPPDMTTSTIVVNTRQTVKIE